MKSNCNRPISAAYYVLITVFVCPPLYYHQYCYTYIHTYIHTYTPSVWWLWLNGIQCEWGHGGVTNIYQRGNEWGPGSASNQSCITKCTNLEYTFLLYSECKVRGFLNNCSKLKNKNAALILSQVDLYGFAQRKWDLKWVRRVKCMTAVICRITLLWTANRQATLSCGHSVM